MSHGCFQYCRTDKPPGVFSLCIAHNIDFPNFNGSVGTSCSTSGVGRVKGGWMPVTVVGLLVTGLLCM